MKHLNGICAVLLFLLQYIDIFIYCSSPSGLNIFAGKPGKIALGKDNLIPSGIDIGYYYTGSNPTILKKGNESPISQPFIKLILFIFIL